MTLKLPNDPQLWLANCARELARGRSVQFHGTPFPNAILKSGELRFDESCGDPVVCFTRSPNEAAFWAALPRDDDEGAAAVFVFDRDRLSMNYWLDPSNTAIMEDIDEQEEQVWGRDVQLAPGLIGVVTHPFSGKSERQACVSFVTVPGFRSLGVESAPGRQYDLSNSVAKTNLDVGP